MSVENTTFTTEGDRDEPALGRIIQLRYKSADCIAPSGLYEIKDFDWNKFAAITLGFRLQNPLLHRVVCDQIEIVCMALEELIKMGYTRPLLAYPAGRDVHVENRWSTSFNGFIKHFKAPGKVRCSKAMRMKLFCTA